MSGVTDPASPYFKDGQWGWDGTVWRKLPMVFGYSDRLAVNESFTATGAGDASGAAFAVAAGYIYVVQAAVVFHDAGVAKNLQYFLYGDAKSVMLVYQPTAVSGTRYMWQGEAALKEGDSIQVWLGAPGDGKSVWVQVWGYKMLIAE